MSGRKAETLKTKASSQANASPKTRGTPKGSEVIEAPVSDIMEKTEDQGSDIIEKAEEIKDVMAQTDPAVEITEIEEPVKEVLNPSASSWWEHTYCSVKIWEIWQSGKQSRPCQTAPTLFAPSGADWTGSTLFAQT